MTASRTSGSVSARSAGPRTGAAIDVLPLILVVIAEAAWISVIAGLVQEYALQLPVLGVPTLIAYIAGGILAARLLARRLDARWPFAALGLTALAAASGWLSGPETRAAIGAGAFGSALATNPGGWLAGLAMMRGFAHSGLPLAEATVGRMLALGIPVLAIAAALGRLVADPWRTTFETDAFVAAIAFAVTGTLGLAFVRLRDAGAGTTLSWRHNPAWAALIAVLIVIAVWFAIPASTMTGTVISWVVSVAMGPLLVLGVIASVQRPGRRIILISIGVAFALVLVGQVLKPGQGGSVTPGGSGGVAAPPDPDDAVQAALGLGLGGVGLLLIAVVVILLARMWMRRLTPPDDDAFETRSIDEGPGRPAPRPRRPRLRRSAPTDAAAAYVALVDDLAAHPIMRRAPAETPAEHARRLRRAGHGGLSMELLAADYELARFGAVSLNAAEDRRAIERWRRLRRELPLVKAQLLE